MVSVYGTVHLELVQYVYVLITGSHYNYLWYSHVNYFVMVSIDKKPLHGIKGLLKAVTVSSCTDWPFKSILFFQFFCHVAIKGVTLN